MCYSARMDDSRLPALARLAVLTGAGLQPGQELLVHAEIEHAPLLRAIADRPTPPARPTSTSTTATRWCAARRSTAGPEESLGYTPPWMPAAHRAAPRRRRAR